MEWRKPASCDEESATKDLFHYFKRDSQSSLPKTASQSTIDAVNREVSRVSSSQSDKASKTQGEYIKITAKDRATVGEYAAKNGIAAAIRHFKQNGSFPNLKEASVRGWKNVLLQGIINAIQ